MACRLLEVVLSLSAPGFGRERTIFFIWSPDPSNFQQFCRENGDTPWAGQEHCSGLCFLTSLIFGGKLAFIKPGTTARTFGPSQLWPRVRNVEGEAEVVVAAAKLLAAQSLRRDENNNSRAFIQEKAECF